MSERNKETALNAFYFDEISSHQYISQALLLYILAVSPSEEEVQLPDFDKDSPPLRYYASQYWPQHCRQVPSDKRPPELLELIHTLFDIEDPRPYIFWLNSHLQDYDSQGYAIPRFQQYLPQFAPPIYFAALFGESELCNWLVENSGYIDDPDRNCKLGNALQAAAFGGYADIVQLFLDEGAQVNTDCGHFGAPLQAAAFGGSLETVELLLKHGAVINTEQGEFGNALIAASHKGHLEIAKKLIECGADPELSSRENGKAISGAAASGTRDALRTTRGVPAH